MTERSSQPSDPASLTQLFQMIAGYWTTQTIYVAAKLGIADLIAETPKTADELAQATKTKAHAPSLRRLLLMLSRRAIRPNGKLLLIESVLKGPNQPDPGRARDLYC